MEVSVGEKKGWYWGGLLLIGVTMASGQKFVNSGADQSVLPLVAIGAAFFYYWLKRKIPIKNSTSKNIVAFLIAEMTAGGLVGVLTAYL